VKVNLTRKLDTDLLKKVRALAAEQGSSLSDMLVAELQELVRRRKAYMRAKKRAIARLHVGMNLDWKKPGSREESHEQ
jgi:NRPS condensation-like uncharacterized protein